MISRTLWNNQVTMLMASGSPGSALAYQLSQSSSEPELLRRNIATNPPSAAAIPVPDRTQAPNIGEPAYKSSGWPLLNWIGHAFDRLDEWSMKREQAEREAYLARAQNVHDLESRMRQLDSDDFSRDGRKLHLGGVL